jgi:hypothetical protein
VTRTQSNIFEDLLHQPDPYALAASPDLVPAMVSGGNRNGMSGTGDKRPMVYRAGSLDELQLPSRMGSTLHYRDGRVETN